MEVVKPCGTSRNFRFQLYHCVVDFDAICPEVFQRSLHIADGGVVGVRRRACCSEFFRKSICSFCCVIKFICKLFSVTRNAASAFFNSLVSTVQNGKRSLVSVYGGSRFFVFFFQPFVLVRQYAESTSLRVGHVLRFHGVVDGFFVERYGFFIGILLIDTAIIHVHFPVPGQDVLRHAVGGLIVHGVLFGLCFGFLIDKANCDFPKFVYVVDALPFFVILFRRLFQKSNQLVPAQVFASEFFCKVFVFIGQVLNACGFRGGFFKGLPPRLLHLTVNHDKGADGSNHEANGSGRSRHVGGCAFQHVPKVLEGISHVFECAYDLFALKDGKQTRCCGSGKTSVVCKVYNRRRYVQNSFNEVGVNGVGDKLRPGVLEDVGLGFPGVQHDADFSIGAPGALRSFVQHLLHHVEVLDQGSQLVGTELAAQAGENIK